MSETPSTNCSMTQPHTSGSEQSLSGRPLNVTEPVVAKRICFYKSGDPQFNGVKMVVNSRSFKSFDALLDNLSKRVPLPFGVRNITTPRGIHSVTNLEDLEDGKSYICSQQRKVKPINLEKASKKPLPWQISRPVSGRRRAIQLAREGEGGVFQRGGPVRISTPKKLLVFKNGDVRIRRTIILGKKNTQNFEAFLDHISELMQYPVVKLYTTDGRKVSSLQALILCSGAVVAAGREPFKAGNYDPHRYSLPGKLPGTSNRIYPRTNAKAESRKMSLQIDPSSRAQMFSAASSKGYSNDNNSDSSYVPDSDMGLTENHSHAGEDLFVVPSVDDIEKSVHLNQDGSMTVEMRVRFKIKDEETIRWTTTVSRAGLSGDRNDKMGTSMVVEEDQSSELNILTCTDNTEGFNSAEDDVAMQQISSEVTDQDSECGMKTHNYDIWQNPSMSADLSQSNNNVSVKPRFYRPPTPGPRRVRQKKALVESVTLVSDTAIQKQMVGQFSYSEEMDNGEAKSEYCVVTHASSKTSSVANPKHSEMCSNQVMKPPLEDKMEETMLNKVGHNATTERKRERDLSSFNSHTEWCQSKSEKICNQCKLLHSSQVSSHLPLAENIKTEFQGDPTVSGSSSIPAKNGSRECVTKAHFSDESRATSSNSKKKAKKKKKKRKTPSDTMVLAVSSQQNLHNTSVEGTAQGEIKASEMHITSEKTQHSSTQITIHKRMVEFPVGHSDGSDKILGTKEDADSQVSMKHQQNELGPHLRQNINRPLPKIQSRSDISVSPSAKQEEGLFEVKDTAKPEAEQRKEGEHDTTSLTENTPSRFASLKSLSEMEHGHKGGTEKGKITSDMSRKSSTKQKKPKMNKNSEGALGSKIKMSDETSTLDTFRHADFTDEMMEHSLENYVQRWLQNIFPNVVMPANHLAPINSNDRNMYQFSVKSLSDNDSQLVEKSAITEVKLSNSVLNHLSEVESIQRWYERHVDCLTDADANMIEEAKYLLQTDMRNSAKLSKCNVTHENDRKKIESGVDNKHSSDDQRYGSEAVAKGDLKAINNILGNDVHKDCVSGLLRQVKLAKFSAENNHIGCMEKSCCLTDTSSPSLLGSSSDLLIAWLLLLNLREKVCKEGMCKDDLVQTSYSSEILTQLQYLKQVANKEEAEDLKAAVSNLQEFSGMQVKKQEPADCQENASLLPGSEKQEKLSEALISNDTVSSNEVAKELTEELESSNEGLETCNVPDKNGHLNDLDVHSTQDPSSTQDPNSTDADSNNCDSIPNEESSKVNEGSSLQESQERNTDTSFNNEESGISEDPNSTIYSMTSNDKDHIFDLETSELDDKELDSTEKQKCDTKLCEKESLSEHLRFTAENSRNCDREEKPDQEDLEEDGTCEDSPEPQSPLSFCYESKQIPTDPCEEELTSRVKQIVKELEGGSHSNSCLDFKKCLKSPATSDLSDYRPETDDSDYNVRPSSDLTNESTEEGLYDEYNKGYVKRTIERLYGKTETSLWPTSKPCPPYMAHTLQKDTEESFHQVVEEAPFLCQAQNTWGDDKVSSLASHEIPGDISSGVWEKENAELPAPQFSLNGEEAYYSDDCSEQYPNQCCQSKKNIATEEGVLTDKGKWLLKENHLIRRSPPETSGMFGYADTTSADTAFDDHSDDIPYSHFGNLHLRPPLKEISSSELEDMAQPDSKQCNYFNMPHNTDSEPFPDDLSTKSKNSQHGSSLRSEAIRKVCTASTQRCAEISSPTPAFASVEFRLSDNKVHPVEQPLHGEPIRAQPSSHTNSNRNIQEDQDSLDKLHAICGQHCPILTAIILPTNEEIRGCAYRKASDVENRVGRHLLTNMAHSGFQGKDIVSLDKNRMDRCINKIANDIFLRCYADNILDFINSHNFSLLGSATLKENQGLKEFHVTENVDANTQESNNPESNAAKEASGEITAVPNNTLSLFQSSRPSVNQIVGERPSFVDITDGCRSGTLHHQETLDKIDSAVTIQSEDENTLIIKEEALSYVMEDESNKDHSDLPKAEWKVIVLTSDLPSASTTSQVYVTLYGDQSNSGAIFLYGEEKRVFERGNTDTFTIHTEDIGNLYKIRIGHTNSGETPAWHCEELQLQNLVTGEQFTFPVHRWLAQDQEDCEVCQELPVLHQGQPLLPVAVYNVQVVTGDLWNAGTEADIYISIYGEKGDTGSRQLHRSKKPKKYVKGQTDVFSLEAVHLGRLRKVVVGHNGLGSGNGWFLEEIVIKDPITNSDYTFVCHRWLDQGEDDGKMVRELYAIENSTFAAREELENKKTEMVKGYQVVERDTLPEMLENYCWTNSKACNPIHTYLEWAAEKWKFQKGNMLQFYNRMTHGFIRLSPDGTVDALGDKKDKYGLFDVTIKKGNAFVFMCHPMPHLALALPLGSVTGMEKSDIRCELQVHLLPNRCAVLESVRNPGQTVAFSLQGTVVDDATGYAGLTKEFVVHVKGVFHDSAIILLTTSYCQSLCLRPDGSCSGAGNQSDDSYWRVHKVSSGVCMFESVKNPRRYLRIKDDHCDGAGTGDVNCHFIVEKNLETGSVSLESSRNRGIYVGLLPDGQTKPVVHTGERNVWFYPQVIQFGREKPMGTSATPGQKEEITQHQAGTQSLMSYRRPYSPPPKEEVRTIQVGESPLPSENKWKVSVLTGNSGTQANVTLWIYGDKGIAGPITLGRGNREQLFLPRMEDAFQVEIKDIGNIYKIRIGHDGTSKQPEWMLEKVKLQHLRSGKILNFPANEWLSRSRGNGDTFCELPVVERGRSLYSIVNYQVYVYTGHLEQAETDSSIYLCIYGERGDSGLRLLHKSDKPVKFQRGMVDIFEIQAVSLGDLQKVQLRCEANKKSQYWYCEKVIIREPEKNSEYIFSCERWLPFMSQGKIHSEIELFLQEMQINRQSNMQEENGEDWKITVVTGDFETAGTTATVSLYAYGENKTSGPLILGSGKHQLFNCNSVDTFKVNLKDIGELYKIRIGHDNGGPDPSWYLNEIRLQRINSPSEQEKHFPLNCWLAEDQDDGDTWREIPIRISKKGLLPLVLYSVGVQTGSNPGAETKSNVYITIFGSRGDSGKRKLHKSINNKIKFRCGQTDVFHVKAVSLGVLNKILISHDGTGPDSGWFLQKVNIQFQEGREGGEEEEVLFPCDRWLDEYQEDGKTKRELIAKKNSNLPMLHVSGQWRVLVKSARDSPEPGECKRTLVVYGSKGKSDELLLFPPSLGHVCFQPGATDEFLIEPGDVGDVYKIRVSCDDFPDFEGWHLKSFHMEELHTNQEVNFDCSCWFSHSQEHGELVKEFPAVNENQKSLPVHQYIVSIHTGDLWGAETFANLYVTLYGERGDTGVRKLQRSFMAGENFQRTKVDSFIVEAVSLSRLEKIVVGHDGEGCGAGIYLKMITVKKSENSDKEWLFPCWNWLDTHLGHCETVCEIKTIGKRLTSCSKDLQINPQSSGLWIMDVIGSDMSAEIDPLQLTFCFYGDHDCKKLAFQISREATQIKVELKHIGSLYKVQISGPHAPLKEPWHLSMLHMKHTDTNQEMWLMFNCWFKPNEEKCIELPTFCGDQDPLPVVEYSIHVHTGDKKKADASGDAYLCIQGDRGDSGKQWLNDSKRGPLSFDRGQVDVFKIIAVHLGTLNQVLVGFKSLKKDDWFLEKIVIKEGNYPFTTYTFLHNNWINKHSKTDFTELVLPLQETNVTSGLVKEFDVKSQGQWRMWVDCAHIPEKMPDIEVLVHGNNGTSIAQRVQNLKNEPFLLTVGDVGRIIKISFILLNQNLCRGIKLVKLRMKDVDTKEELGFYPLNQWLFEEDGSETVAELAAVRPNEAPLKEVTYSISVYTGTLPASETDADIFITLFGENGDSSKRKLKNSKSCAHFEKGQVSTFHLQAIDLGKLSEVHVEHNRHGYGAGWYLDKITVQDAEKQDCCCVFSCQQWLDSGVGDGKIKREMQLLGKVRKERLAENVHGAWDVTIISKIVSSSGMNPKLTLTACDDKGASASVCISKGSFKRAEIYQASLDLDKKFSTICKVRLEVEDTDGETWRCCKMKLQHRKSKETLEFPCLRDFSDAEGDTVAEFPVLTDGCNFLTVREYELYLSTDTSPGSGTDADVYVTLRGSMGDTGRRKISRNGKDAFTRGKVDVFQVKAVDLGTLHELVVEKGKGSDWHLEKIIVKEPKFAGRTTLFMAQTWLRDRMDRKNCASITLNVTEIQEGRSMTASLLRNQQMKSEGSWKIYFTKCLQDSSKAFEKSWENISKLIMVFYGSSGKSEPISVAKTIQDQVEDQITCDVHLTSELGMFYKVKFGLQHLGASTSQLFHHCRMQHTVTLDTFSLSINKTLPLLNGDQWIELPVEWPLREALSVVTYHVKILSNDILSMINLVHISLCIYGTNGDTEDRPLLLSLPSGTQKEDKESCTCQVDAVDLGDLQKVTLLIGSRSSGKVSVKALHLNEKPKQEPVYVFEVNETFHLDANAPEIRREISLSWITKENGDMEDLAELVIKVYTGDKRGAGTDASVHIILFGDKDSSQLIQLEKSLDHRDPFERGKLDTFRIKTKKVGRLQKIEIGHNGKGFASGWFLDKVEIIDMSTNDQYCFSCNRWLAEDENDGRTAVQLYA